MLDDQPDDYERSLIWLRVSIELPLSIAQQNITTIGGNAMNKLTSISNKKLALRVTAVVGVALVLLIVIFRVPIQRTLLPNTVGMFYRHGLNKVLSGQNANIADPFMAVAGDPPHTTYGCYLVGASGIKTRIGCESRYQMYTVLGQSAADKAKNVEAAKRVGAALKSQGYEAGSNGITFESLVAGTYNGKDYSPDAYYQKTVGNNRCIFDTQIAYSNPKQPAINMMLTCNRTIDLFGDPSNGVDGPQNGYQG